MPAPFRFSASLAATSPDDLTSVARRAEELGYSSVTLSDHFTEQPAPLIGLTAAAVATTSLRVLPLVLANDFRNPVVLAQELATLDRLSAGRLEFGIGAGWMTTDYTVNGNRPGPAPTQVRVPLLLAGGKRKMLTLAGQEADIVGINPALTAGVIDERAGRNATLAETDKKLAWVRDGAGARFDDLELQTRIHLAMVTDDRDAVAAELAPLLGISAEEALASPHALVGSAQQCIDEVQRWRDRWGLSYVSINAENMEEFAPVVEFLTGR
jgi:alkanesulfonate monooxygenase SsuD/methylene tetrahydromethanopterin reductase-like flavin-dependent oxidoreductase (luciferase family)